MDDITIDLIRQVSRLQAQVDGLVKPEVGRWTTFTPTLYQNNTTVTSTVTTAQYFIKDNKANVLAVLQATAAGTIATRIDIELPAILAPSSGASSVVPLGVFHVLDSGLAFYNGIAYYSALVAGLTRISGIAHAQNNAIGATPSFALASGDFVGINLTYRI